VIGMGPAGGANQVGLGSPVIILFNEPLMESTLNSDNVVLMDAFGRQVSAALSYDDIRHMVVLVPDELTAYMTYYLWIAPDVRSCAGKRLELPFQSYFTTGDWF